jgi:type VI secretion system protein ImpJ
MTMRPVHWEEGMFLLPQHLQAAQRYGTHLSQLGDKWNQHYSWGLRSCELDTNAFANYRFVVRTLKARLRDGTLIAIPEDNVLTPVELKAAFERTSPVRVFLAVPLFDLGRANASPNSSPDKARYLWDTQDLEDENTGQDRKAVRIRRLNVRLLLSTEDAAGYETLPIAQLKKTDRAEATPELDAAYIPPVLACDAWKPLSAGILEYIYDRIGMLLEKQTGLVVSRGIGLESQAPGDRLIVEQLRALNEAYAMLRVLAFAEGVHPLSAYLELCRLVGQLVIFSRKIGPRTPHDLLPYDHDDLGRCFASVRRYIDQALDFDPIPYQERPFQRVGERMEVKLEREWLEPSWQIYVGVQTSLSTDQCIRLLSPGGLDMKIASAAQVDQIYTLATRGLKFDHVQRSPRALPSPPGLNYFKVDPQSQPAVWQDVKEKLTLALRLNGKGLVESPDNEPNELTIRASGGQTASMKFTLYVLSQEK